jgi:hypothetical protein
MQQIVEDSIRDVSLCTKPANRWRMMLNGWCAARARNFARRIRMKRPVILADGVGIGRACVRGRFPMRALSIRQPYAELILRGVKTAEFRSRRTNILGERFYIYAAKGPARSRATDVVAEGNRIWSDDLAVPGRERGTSPPVWMMELAQELILGRLPTGLIVGTARISECREYRGAERGLFAWHLADVERLVTPIKPERHPQPAWFRPF